MGETIQRTAQDLCKNTPNCPRKTWKIDSFRGKLVPGRCYLEGCLTDAYGHGGGREGAAKEADRLSRLTAEEREETCARYVNGLPSSKGRSARKRSMPEASD